MKDVDYIELAYYLKVNPGDTAYPLFARKGENWKEKLNSTSKDSTFRLYIFQVDTVKAYGWKNIIANRQYERLNFTAAQLDSAGWKIVYK